MNAYIYNAFGQYESRNDEPGIALPYAGLEFWLPFEKTTPIPNYTFRELDHDRSTPQLDSPGELVYQNVIVPGGRVAEELVNKQIPVSYSAMGVMIVQGKPVFDDQGQTKIISLLAGHTAEGLPIYVDTVVKEATKSEVTLANKNAKLYKEQMVQEYFQSKRSRMMGGQGRHIPDARIRLYLEELGLTDIDDVAARKSSGLDSAMLTQIITAITSASDERLAEVLKSLSPNAKHAKRSQGLAEHAAEWDAKQVAAGE